jgi:hypothetical protein
VSNAGSEAVSILTVSAPSQYLFVAQFKDLKATVPANILAAIITPATSHL